MEVASYLLFVLGVLGAADIAMYHSVSHGIRNHPDSRAELITHSLRGPTYAVLFVLLPNFSLKGWWFGLLVIILIFDLLISLIDFALERKSRSFFNGLPSGEYVLHTVIAMVFGAMVSSVFYEGGRYFYHATSITYFPAVPEFLRAIFVVMAVLVLISGTQDAVAVLRLGGQPMRAPNAK
ncbi:MAG: hypothetical protein SGI88_14435 [Candidatus Hydrogenedentes bacterium]|nr:hypothetical protein [Candidatus Hydrogenedentota bacterium]